MSTYLVVKRLKEERVYMPGEMMVDHPRAAILLERGYIQPVPDNFVPPITPTAARGSGQPLQVPSKPVEGAASPASGSSLTFQDLMSLTRKELNELAETAGVLNPEDMASKGLVSQAILDKTAADDAATEAAEAAKAAEGSEAADHDHTFDTNIGA